MISYPFDYVRPESVEEALEHLGGDTKILAGGHSLLPTLKLRLSAPDKLVDIARIASLKKIKKDGDEIVIGGAVTHREIMDSEIIQKHLPVLSEGAAVIGDPMIRYKGTMGGSLAHADPSADWSAMVLAAGGEIVIQSKKGKRTVPATEFFTGFYSTALKDGDILIEIRFPVPEEGTKMTYQKFTQPASRFALVGCAAARLPDGSARVAFTGVADAPFRDKGVEEAVGDWSEATLEAAAQKAAEGQNINADHYASEEYRLHLAKVYCKRALLQLVN
ncbi:FAD binding domain-containing protein [Persicitalea jodogahamensis]|uniref:Carbon-monoxide dehydrogenase medium subunit n=1 Tax=Persicitalea jodogahamensis TaxID=402147 RepID=A0A8J3GAZ2_9BACT|nr:xanthine dehydrogenase family protein subunit M [Persicitalea jodogahamensis]GHB83761.1 carbon-monoxide dehydrogenase medium subunit [Persicitalea jodogahamensis]